MDTFLKKLIHSDSRLKKLSKTSQIVQQGLAPIAALSNQSTSIQKANLLERAKLQNWNKKSQELFAQLSKQGIQFLVFKGFAYTYLLYNQSHLRPYSDIDIIVDETDYKTVKVILLGLGYQQYPSRQGKFVSFQNSFFDNSSPQTIIDLHWQINNRIEFHKHYNFTDLLANAIELQSEQFKTLGLIDGFILGCFHYQAHRPNDRKHVWLYDLALMWNKMSNTQHENCFNKAQVTNQSNIIITTLSIIEQTFVDCFNFDFKKYKLEHEETGYYLQERKSKIFDIKTRIKNIDGFKNKTKFISEYVFQSRNYVKRRFALKTNQWVYIYYPRMWIEDFFKLFK